MKIKVNDKESYSIELEEEINLNQLNFIIDRLIRLKKLFSDENPMSIVKNAVGTTPFVTRTRNKTIWSSWDRETSRTALTIYHQSIPLAYRKEKLLKLGVTDYADFSSSVHGIRKKYNFTPQELGIERFPVKGEGRHIEVTK